MASSTVTLKLTSNEFDLVRRAIAHYYDACDRKLTSREASHPKGLDDRRSGMRDRERAKTLLESI